MGYFGGARLCAKRHPQHVQKHFFEFKRAAAGLVTPPRSVRVAKQPTTHREMLQFNGLPAAHCACLCYNPAMHGRVFFRDAGASVTSTELVVGSQVFSLADILSARAFRRRHFLFTHRYVLMIATVGGEQEVLCHRNGYLVFQLARALECAVRERKRNKIVPLSGTKDSTAATAESSAPRPLPSVQYQA